MRHLHVLPAIFSLACVALASCGSSSGSGTQTPPPPPPAPDIYIAGLHGSNAAYWKNGTEVDLASVPGSPAADAIAVSGSTVVAAGASLINLAYVQGYVWTNGAAVALNDNGLQTQPNSVALSGSDVYVAGYSFNYDPNNPVGYAVLWKNGVPTHLTASITSADNGLNIATQVVLSGSDVYVAGSQFVTTQSGDVPQALYWKNGTAVTLTDGSYAAGASGIAVSGSDVYVSGVVCNPDCAPYYWKNGAGTQLASAVDQDGTSSIAVGNGNVWITGDYDGQPIAFDNGQQLSLPFASGSITTTHGSAAYSDDFYTVGSADDLQTNQQTAIAWKNQQQLLTVTFDGQNSAFVGIAVVAPPD